MQVVPELIDARTGSVKWQQSFDNDITDVFEVQSQIASRVAGALGVALAGEKQEQQPAHGERRGLPALPEGAGDSARRPGVAPEQIAFLEQAVALDSAFSTPGTPCRSPIRGSS